MKYYIKKYDGGDKVYKTPQWFIDFIKKQETFSPVAYKDNTGYSVGYGSQTMLNGKPTKAGDKMTEKEKVEAYYSIWSNNSVSKIFEPGSVFKTFTIAELIEEDLIDLKDVFICDGYGVYNSSKILCHGGVGHEELTVTGALGQSCNDCLMQFGDILGKRIFSKYLDVFKIHLVL